MTATTILFMIRIQFIVDIYSLKQAFGIQELYFLWSSLVCLFSASTTGENPFLVAVFSRKNLFSITAFLFYGI